jgi:hypothetical protein
MSSAELGNLEDRLFKNAADELAKPNEGWSISIGEQADDIRIDESVINQAKDTARLIDDDSFYNRMMTTEIGTYAYALANPFLDDLQLHDVHHKFAAAAVLNSQMSNAELSEVVITQVWGITMFPVSHVLDQLTAYDPELEDIKTRVLAAITRIHINEKSKK